LLKSLFRQRRSKAVAQRLYAAVVEQARTPAFYLTLGAPDTMEGRFELYSLHVILLLRRLNGQGPEAAEAAQALLDAYTSALDHGLRESGVGDLSVPRRMRRLAEAVLGRAASYDASLADDAALQALIGRTVFAGSAGPTAAMAAYVKCASEALSAQPLETLLEGAVAWPEVAA